MISSRFKMLLLGVSKYETRLFYHLVDASIRFSPLDFVSDFVLKACSEADIHTVLFEFIGSLL